MKPVYLLLSRSGTLLSRCIHAATRDGYTHVSIALDRNLAQLYSFARKYSYMPLPAGLVHENVHAGVFGRNGDAPCALYRLMVSDHAHAAIAREIDEMLHASRSYRYSILGLILCKLGIAHTRPRRLFCSQFVASLLQAHASFPLPKPASVMRPMDFAGLPGLQCCYEGPLAGCAAQAYSPAAVYACTTKPEHVY